MKNKGTHCQKLMPAICNYSQPIQSHFHFHKIHIIIIRLPNDFFPLFYSQSLQFTPSFPHMTLKSLKLIKAERYYIKLCYFQNILDKFEYHIALIFIYCRHM